MMKTDNPYKIKRKKLILRYVKADLIVFLCSVPVAGAYKALGWKLFHDLLLAFSACGGVLFLAFAPVLGWVIYLTVKGREYEQERRAAASAPAKAPEIDEPLSDRRQMARLPSYSGFLKRGYGPWWSVVTLIVCLPPLGLYYCYRKASADPENYLENAPVLIAAGLTLLLIGTLTTLFNLWVFQGFEGLALVIALPGFMVVSGAFLYVYGRSIRKKGRFIARCQSLIWVEAVLSVDALAEKFHKTYGQMVRALQKAINEGFLFSCFIDYQKREVVAPVRYPKVAVKCVCGGTTVKLEGVFAVCAYCGRRLPRYTGNR